MPYSRRYAYKGIERLRDNVLAILARDLNEAVTGELALIRTETGATLTTLPNFAEFLGAQKEEVSLPCLVLEPDVDDDEEGRNGQKLDQGFGFDITIVAPLGDDLELVTRDIMRRKRAVKNVLWSMSPAEILAGYDTKQVQWEVRGGRYTWVKPSGEYARAVKDLKLIVNFSEVVSRARK